MKKLTGFIADRKYINQGCDPEFFFSNAAGVVESANVLPELGIDSGRGKIVIDGLQAELNPSANSCREVLGVSISQLFRTMSRNLAMQSPDIKPSFSTAVTLTDADMEKLSDRAKTFGCSPSQNLDKEVGGKISVDPSTYRVRTAGGHIHLGEQSEIVWRDTALAHIFTEEQHRVNAVLKKPELLVPVLDAIVGNTCVLIDRDPINKERRKVYGRAGEFRTPAHGLEYRTLSNFWLQSYTLFSMVFNLTRDAVNLFASSDEDNDFVEAVMERIDMRQVTRAINENDWHLAYRNFRAIQPVMSKIVNPGSYSIFAPGRVKQFKYFAKKPMGYWFKEDPLTHWSNLGIIGQKFGIESFLDSIVTGEMQRLTMNQKLENKIAEILA